MDTFDHIDPRADDPTPAEVTTLEDPSFVLPADSLLPEETSPFQQAIEEVHQGFPDGLLGG